MNSKLRFIPLVVIGAIILSLMAIPAFSATGILSFYLTADPDTEQEWARLGGMVGLQVEDADLDVPIKYVILPNDLDQVGTTTIVTVADSDTITVADALVVHPVTTNNPDSAGILAVGNTLLVEGNTVRVVEQIDLDADGDGDNANDDATVTLNRSLSVGGMTVVSEVNNNFANGEDCPTCAEAPKVTLTTGQQILNLKNTPIIDSGAGSSTNKFDDTGNDKTVDGDDVALVSIGSTDATVGNAVSSGTVFITVATQGDVHAVYWGSSENDTDDTITVRSSGDSDGIEVVLDETGASTGVFRQSIELIDEYPTPKVPNQIRVEPNGTVTLRYSDGNTTRTKTIRVETTEPILSNFSPANDRHGTVSRPDVAADLTDSDSGVDEGSVYVIFAIMDAANNASLAESVRVDDDGDFTDITNGVRVEARLPRDMQPDDDATIAWWVVAQDKAGNLVVSDADTADNNDCDAAEFPPIGTDGALIIENNVDDAEELNGEPVLNDERVGNDGSTRVPQCQPFTVNVDFTDPALSSAMTGAFWDDDSEDDDKTNGDTSKGKRTSVMVTFSEALDGSSVRASDFEVDGVQPLDADHYADAGEKVFLTVAEFAPNHRPDVDLVGPVEDLAGNVVNSGGVEDAADGVAPTLTVTVEGVANGDRPVTDGDVTVKISTDENTGNPTVVVRRVSYEALNERVEVTPVTTPATFMDEAKLDDNSDAVMDSVLLEAGAENETATLTSTRNFEVTINLDDDGLYNVNVFATDNSGNTGIAGTALAGREALADATATVATLETIVDVSGDTSAMLVEVDTAGPEATLDPPVSDNPNAFIEIDFAEEAAEYDPDKDYDTHSMVTIVSAMLDGMDIADDMERLGNGSFLYAALGLAVGEYDIVVEAEDTVGNDQETTLTLTIEERAPFELNIRAGVSLISFPGDPEDGDINAVFPAGHPVQRVLTYDPTQPGRWFSARRGDDGMLTGTLMSIRAGAYLVEAASTEPIHVQIERPEFQLPPSLDLVAGWNLVPIIDTSFQLDQGDPIALGNYFSNGLDVISRIYGINPVSKQLESVTLVGLSQVRVGSGYWVFADEAVSIAP